LECRDAGFGIVEAGRQLGAYLAGRYVLASHQRTRALNGAVIQTIKN
jgi:hypothetical protein